MARYTARHAHRPSKGHAYKRPAHKYDQPKPQHDKPSAVRRLTALAAAAAALIGGAILAIITTSLARETRQLQHSLPLVSWQHIQKLIPSRLTPRRANFTVLTHKVRR